MIAAGGQMCVPEPGRDGIFEEKHKTDIKCPGSPLLSVHNVQVFSILSTSMKTGVLNDTWSCP